MSRYQPYRGVQGRRYQAVMKSWRRLRHSEAETAIRQRSRRRRLLEELRALDLETYDHS
ncbi:hypothetical protein FDG2_4194 [Candidatus Protofrankia californiensis]|uniref:Uncharacterized protein n=1 Tax=Candidatus Protofrankia californiensis TaxID=1839754 RepID=A0A1C3P3W7_9ACTN|nr:hypothetical protein FDG2_4194 [Candidatus Protofrankia californiensis]